jgi:membrane protein
VAASILWLAGSVAFTAYVPVFARYDVIYGSLAAVVVLQLWLYASAFILLLGAQLNVELQSGVA